MGWFPGAAQSFFVRRVGISWGVRARVASVSGGKIETDRASVVWAFYQSMFLFLVENAQSVGILDDHRYLGEFWAVSE